MLSDNTPLLLPEKMENTRILYARSISHMGMTGTLLLLYIE